MIRFAIKRLLLAIPTLIAMLTAVFILVRLVPGDPAAVMLGDQASAEALAALRAQLGLDRPVLEQYLAFLGDVLTGNLGVAMSTGRPVLTEVLNVLPWTLQLTALLYSLVPCLACRWAFGHRYSATPPDYLGRLISLTGLSFPAFVSAILMLLVFAIQLGWFPVISTTNASSWTEELRNLALPAFNLGLIMMAYVMRVTRSSMLGVMGEDYIRTARAKGIRPMRLILRHGLRNALIPIITVVGLYFGTLIGNSVLTEIVFNRPGLGKLILGALNVRDYTLLQGLMIVFASCVILVNLLTDLIYGLVDPRVKYQ